MNDRARLDGKFFGLGTERFFVKGVTYGSFRPNAAGEPFPEPDQAARDLDLIRDLRANTIRVYDIPPPWLMDAAAERGLRLFVTAPWTVESCFLDTRASRRTIRTAVISTVQAVAHHPATFAVALANEIPPDVARWSGPCRVAAFLDELADAARDVAPDCLLTYAGYPPSEFLLPRNLDFVTFNVFLHSRPVLARYLARLQMLAEGKPLLLGECGIDSRREGLERQAEILSWTIDTAVSSGLAGAVIFTFTDEWHRNDAPVTDWEMGLTTAAREPKPAWFAVQTRFAADPPSPPESPRVSVVVATHNGGRTLQRCLESLTRLNHSNYEIIVVDDGSTDDTPSIVESFPQVRGLRLRENLGLSNARNLGIRAATGEIIAFTDDDCRADPDWLRFLVARLQEDSVAGVGGPNLLPPDDSAVAAVVHAAPGGPAHVMLDDQFAEHIPGCNMAFWKWALDAIDGFDVVFERAGDDVDVCWRLQRRGWRLGFAPAAFVWHYRRSTVSAYLRQQAGYGDAEALLMAKHPAQFNALGGARWKGRICAAPQVDLPWNRWAIHHGPFAGGLFQTLYTPVTDNMVPLLTSLEYHLFIILPLFVLSFSFPTLWVAFGVAVAVPVTTSIIAGFKTWLPGNRARWWSRLLLVALYFLQPLVRGAARYARRFGLPSSEERDTPSLEAEARFYAEGAARERAYWTAQPRDRREWVLRILEELESRGWPCRADSGWDNFDVEVMGRRWNRVALVTVAEYLRGGAQILRCRVRTRWTLFARVVFWGVAGLLALMAGLFDVNWRGFWVPIVVLGGLALYFRHRARALQCRVSVILDDVAKEWGLTPVPAERSRRSESSPEASGTRCLKSK